MVQRFLHGPFSCLESQWRSSLPWLGRVECRELHSCGPEMDKNKTEFKKKRIEFCTSSSTDAYTLNYCVVVLSSTTHQGRQPAADLHCRNAQNRTCMFLLSLPVETIVFKEMFC